MSTFDVIIIGAGLSGLCTGALLANRGQKVLLLEKAHAPGGRAASIKYQGHILDNGAHMPDESGQLEEVFETLGLEYPALMGYRKGEGYIHGAWKPMREIFPLKEAQEVFKEFTDMSMEEVDRHVDISIKDWSKSRSDVKNWPLLFKYFGQLLLVGNNYEDLSMGELIFIFREHFKRGKSLGQIGGTVIGGLSSLTEPLKNYIETHGGEIRFNSSVNDIIVDENRVKGVDVEVGERFFPSQILDTEVIEAPVVVSSLPLWDIFKVISEDEFPVWYRGWIHNLRKNVSHVWTVVYAVEKPLWDIDMFKWVPKLSRTGVFGIFFQHQSYGDQAGQVQINLVLQGNQDILPDLSKLQWAKTRKSVRQFLDLLEEDAQEILPGLAEAMIWRIRQAAVFGSAEVPGIAGGHKPSMVAPGIENLFMVSDSVREGRGLGMQSAAKASIAFVKKYFRMAKEL